MIAAIQSVLATLAMTAVQGTVLVAIALLLVRGGRLRPAWQAAVWLVVLAKFVLPWGPTMPWSLSDVIASLREETQGGSVVFVHARAIAATAPVALAPAVAWIALAVAWLAGTALVLHRALRARRTTLRTVRTAPPAPQAAQELLAVLARRVRVRAPTLVVSDAGVGPYVVGALRPVIAVPPGLLDDAVLLRAALLHELAHIRRRDALGGLLQLAARAIYWWWPIVHFASRRLELARERACDAWALDACEISRPAYARLLLRMSQLRVAGAASLAAPHALDARIAAVLGPAARPRLGVAHRAALIGWALLALGGARTAAAQGSPIACAYTPQLAEAFRQAYPDADADGDGVLSRDEACEYQAELRRRAPDAVVEVEPSTPAPSSTPLLAEPLCCNCDDAARPYGPLTSSTEASCSRDVEGESR